MGSYSPLIIILLIVCRIHFRCDGELNALYTTNYKPTADHHKTQVDDTIANTNEALLLIRMLARGEGEVSMMGGEWRL